MTHKRYILANIHQYTSLLSQKPALAGLPTFAPVMEAVNIYRNTKGCKCKSKVNLNDYRVQFEHAMASLSPTEKGIMKEVLNANEICYYTRKANGGLSLNCF